MNKYIGAVLLFSLISCQNAEQNTVSTQDSTSVAQVDNSPPVRLEDENIQAIYTAYIQLKDDLVEGKHEEAKKSSAQLAEKLKAQKGCENTALIANKIAAAKALPEQRKEFTFLNADVIPLMKHASLKEGVVYVQRCPMANEGDGGEWLASEKNIRNPYYGDEMMECGSVIEEIKGK